jgi:hypothetical protein
MWNMKTFEKIRLRLHITNDSSFGAPASILYVLIDQTTSMLTAHRNNSMENQFLALAYDAHVGPSVLPIDGTTYLEYGP